ncbi:MAG: class I SAM-dependent methyltransferase [Cyanosarcina radialis HA8281-LM2]|jgi:SAM-dependent methyltransferase|nr:class I SAM-dependent methyltransferase [Cyanosarcina radialis HA8281-LM2]
MDYQELKETISSFSSRDLEQRKNWYSPAAEAYDRARPSYPEEVINRVAAIANLSSDSKILEVGCGPGTATVGFARLGCSILSLEPNPDFYKLAKQNCQQYSNVEIKNIAFEEWAIEPDRFDAVLAASSFHWIPSDVGYPKAAKALRENGCIILLWNKELQPNYETYQRLSEVYQLHAPELDRYEDREMQESILKGLGQIAIDSGQFKNVVAGYIEPELTYTADRYLTLLNTYSPYLKLDPQTKKTLFEGLKTLIERDFDGHLELSYISAFHVAQKLDRSTF